MFENTRPLDSAKVVSGSEPHNSKELKMKSKIAVICSTGLVIVGVLIAINFERNESQYLETTTRESSSVEEVSQGLSESQVALNSPHAAPAESDGESLNKKTTNVNFDQIKRRFGTDYDPMILVALGDFSDAEIAAYNDLHILPFNRATGHDCRQEVSIHSPNSFVTVCETMRERPKHAYEYLDSDELVDLAEHDSVASLILGQRTNNAEERISYYLRAAALSGKSGPIIALAEKRYSSFVLSTRVDGKQVNVPLPENLVVRLALESIAQKMGDPRAQPDKWREEIKSHNDMEPATAIIKSSELANNWLKEMIEVQRTVTGSTQLGGISDA
jgi:hypothetical protein